MSMMFQSLKKAVDNFGASKSKKGNAIHWQKGGVTRTENFGPDLYVDQNGNPQIGARKRTKPGGGEVSMEFGDNKLIVHLRPDQQDQIVDKMMVLTDMSAREKRAQIFATTAQALFMFVASCLLVGGVYQGLKNNPYSDE